MKLFLYKIIGILIIFASFTTYTNALTNPDIMYYGQLTTLISPNISNINPRAIAITHDSKNVYIANNNTSLFPRGDLLQFYRNDTTGLLSELNSATIPIKYWPVAIAISPDDKNVYVTTNGNDIFSNGKLLQFRRNKNTGQLVKIGHVISTGNQPVSIKVSSDGNNVYVVNFGSNIVQQFSRNNVTGLLTELTPSTVQTQYGPNALTISPDGKDVYISNYISGGLSHFTRNTITGQLMIEGDVIQNNYTPTSIVISYDGNDVYVTTTSNKILEFIRNTYNGQLTLTATVSSVGPTDITISQDGNNVYVTNSISLYSVAQYKRNTVTGLLTELSPENISVTSNPFAIITSVDDKNVYVIGQNTLLQFSRKLDNNL
ncbi:MAG: beta-propeller fold lactonase family protein [Burkholderiales bacterium]|nr:beta-propeller fold lactonase family protein [Burkholderiales bacterium]